jgi:hypothetical protein
MDFDFDRLDPSRYQLDDPIHCLRLQNMMKDFLHIVRNNPGALANKLEELNQFCSIISDDRAWCLAVVVVPELRRDQ